MTKIKAIKEEIQTITKVWTSHFNAKNKYSLFGRTHFNYNASMNARESYNFTIIKLQTKNS